MPNKSSRRPDKVRKPVDGHTNEASFGTSQSHSIASQDSERRRIARELHDSLGQKVIGLKMNLERIVRSPNLSSENAALLSESVSLIEAITKEVRTISYLLHPPLLDELGLISALHSLLDGLSQRSGIKTRLRVDDGFGRLPAEMEISVYRIVQESLTNVYRHSGSPTAAVHIQRSPAEIVVEVQDNGIGMRQKKTKAGVGLNGMRERAGQLGGTLEIKSNGQGTTVVARLPVRT